MNFVILVPLAWLPLLIVVMVLVEVLGDYLFTMVAWFLLALAADVILFILLMPGASSLEFAICLLLIPMLAPFVGCYVRSEREQRHQKRQEAAAKVRRAEEDAERERERVAQELEREMRRMAEDAAVDARMAEDATVDARMAEDATVDARMAGRAWIDLTAYETKHGWEVQ
jgi:membrane protein implicated in regulation of membrane protease activity